MHPLSPRLYPKASSFRLLTMEDQLTDIEQDVCGIMEIAKQTLEKLQSLPSCNESEIAQLSTQYMDLVAQVQSKMKLCSGEILSLSLTPEKAPYADLLKKHIAQQSTQISKGTNS